MTPTEVIVYRSPWAFWDMFSGDTGVYVSVILGSAIVALIVMVFVHSQLEKAVFRRHRQAMWRQTGKGWDYTLFKLWAWNYTSLWIGAVVWVGLASYLLHNIGAV